MKEEKKGLFSTIIAFFKAKTLKRLEKLELINMINNLNAKLKLQIDTAVSTIEELSQEKLYFLHAEVDDEELNHLKQEFTIIKQKLKWTIPNILILNEPLIELSEEKLRELETNRKKLRGKNNG